MTRFTALSLLAAAILPIQSGASAARIAPLSTADRAVAGQITATSGKSMARGAALARRNPDIAQVTSSAEGIALTFKDGAHVVIVPPVRTSRRAFVPMVLPSRPAAQTAPAPATQRAAVLLPFAKELGEGPDAAQTEVAALKSAGFAVDVFMNSDVTVALMQKLTDYSAIYIETHSYVSPDGSVAVIVTGQSDAGPSAAFIKDGTVQQALVAGDPTRTLYLGINQHFIEQHMGMFPNSTLLDLNGCDVLRATDFWDVLRSHNVATMISWDHEVYNTINEFSADYMFARLALNESVQQVVTDTTNAGLGASVVGTETAHLGFVGDGNNSLVRALKGELPTPTATVTATATATATVTPTPKPAVKGSKKHKCKKGHKLVKRKGKYVCIAVKKKKSA